MERSRLIVHLNNGLRICSDFALETTTQQHFRNLSVTGERFILMKKQNGEVLINIDSVAFIIMEIEKENNNEERSWIFGKR